MVIMAAAYPLAMSAATPGAPENQPPKFEPVRPANAIALGRGVGGVEAWIDPDDVQWSYSRSSGPGGQNVNKVNTKAELRLAIGVIRGMDEAAAARLTALSGRRVTKDGEIVITAETHRSQIENREECLSRLLELTRSALTPPKKRRPTKVSKSQKRKRLENKKRSADKKSARRWRPE
jgi:ribosome-associated protein